MTSLTDLLSLSRADAREVRQRVPGVLVSMKKNYRKRLLRETMADRMNEYVFAFIFVVIGGYLLFSSWPEEPKHPGVWAVIFMGTLLIATGAYGAIATTQRYRLRFLPSTSNLPLKQRFVKQASKSNRTLSAHVAKDNALIELGGRWGRNYRIRIFFDTTGYYVHSALRHHRFVAPVHLGFSDRQTDRVVAVLKSIDPEA